MTPFRQRHAIQNAIRLYLGYSPKKKVTPTRRPEPVEMIIRQICTMVGASYDTVMSKTSVREVVMVRFIVAHYLRENMLMGWSEIGCVLNKNHGTAVHYVRQYHALKSTKDKVFMKLLERVMI